MIEIEFEEPNILTCDCCGNESVSLTRFVYSNRDAHAVYYAKFTNGHEDKVVHGLIGLGEWGDDGNPDLRTAFPFRIWVIDDQFQVGLANRDDSPWRDVTFLGEILDRDKALKHDWIQEVFHITDHMMTDDKVIIDYFNS